MKKKILRELNNLKDSIEDFAKGIDSNKRRVFDDLVKALFYVIKSEIEGDSEGVYRGRSMFHDASMKLAGRNTHINDAVQALEGLVYDSNEIHGDIDWYIDGIKLASKTISRIAREFSEVDYSQVVMDAVSDELKKIVDVAYPYRRKEWLNQHADIVKLLDSFLLVMNGRANSSRLDRYVQLPASLVKSIGRRNRRLASMLEKEYRLRKKVYDAIDLFLMGQQDKRTAKRVVDAVNGISDFYRDLFGYLDKFYRSK